MSKPPSEPEVIVTRAVAKVRELLAEALAAGDWGTITILFRGGIPTLIEKRERYSLDQDS
jgi:hypothetical protein